MDYNVQPKSSFNSQPSNQPESDCDKLNGFCDFSGVGRVSRLGLKQSEKQPEYYHLFLTGFKGGSEKNPETNKYESIFYFVKLFVNENMIKNIKHRLIPNANVYISGSPIIKPRFNQVKGQMEIDISISFPDKLIVLDKLDALANKYNTPYSPTAQPSPAEFHSSSDIEDYSHISSDDIPF